jgi:hypothetical protein
MKRGTAFAALLAAGVGCAHAASAPTMKRRTQRRRNPRAVGRWLGVMMGVMSCRFALEAPKPSRSCQEILLESRKNRLSRLR